MRSIDFFAWLWLVCSRDSFFPPFRYFVPDAINKEKQTMFYFGHFVVRAQAICF